MMRFLLLLLCTTFANVVDAQSTSIFINEFHYDNPSTDINEFVELAGPAGTNLMGWSIVLYNGADKLKYSTVLLTADDVIPDERRKGYGTLVFDYPANGIQNGAPDGIALVNGAGSCIQFLSYEGAFTALDGPCSGVLSTNIGVLENGSTANTSLQLIGNGLVYEDFYWSVGIPPTRGEINLHQSFGGTIMINEIVGSTTSDDVEFIEIFGTPGTSLAGLTVIVVESDPGADFGIIDRRLELPVTATIGGNGFYLIGNIFVSPNFGVTPDLIITQDFIENSSYTLALIRTSVLNTLGIPLASNSALQPQPGTIDSFAVRDIASATDFFFNAPIYGPQDGGLPAGIRRFPDGSNTIVLADFGISGNTPVAATGGDILFIDEIQGAGEVSPYVGSLVSITGVVVGDFQNSDVDMNRNLQGFYLQEEESDYDNDVLTSEGIFVFDDDGDFDVSVGDLVTVVGTVTEYNGETQITNIVSIVIQGTAPLPSPTDISLLSMNMATVSQDGGYQPDLEAYEGMLVSFPETLQITEQVRLARYNEIKLVAGERPYQFTQLNDPAGADEYQEYMEEVGKRTITYDDGFNSQAALISQLEGFGPVYLTSTAKRMGDQITGLSGVLSYQWAGDSTSGSTWRVRSTVDGENTFTPVNGRPESPTPLPVGKSGRPSGFRMVSFNVQNFFTTLVNGSGVSGPSGLDPRGADDEFEYNRQLEKLVTAIKALDADILGLVELENEFGDQNGDGKFAIGELVKAINAAIGSITYDFVHPGSDFIGDDAIAVGIIYKPAKLELIGDSAILDSSIDSRFIDDKNLPTFAVSFRKAKFSKKPKKKRAGKKSSKKSAKGSSGNCFTVSVNHWKSKATDCSDIGDQDALNGQGNCNGVRTAAAEALVDWLQADPTGANCLGLAILGTLNAYAKEDPIKILEVNGFINALPSDAYSDVSDGQIGTLNYIFVNSQILPYLMEAQVWHINADEASAIDYNTDVGRDINIFDGDVPFRSSEFDPIVAQFTYLNDEQYLFD